VESGAGGASGKPAAALRGSPAAPAAARRPAASKRPAAATLPPSPRVPMASKSLSSSNVASPRPGLKAAPEEQSGAQGGGGLAGLPFFKPAAPVAAVPLPPKTPERSMPARASLLRSPSAKSPGGGGHTQGGFGASALGGGGHTQGASQPPLPPNSAAPLARQASLEEMARSCASPAPYQAGRGSCASPAPYQAGSGSNWGGGGNAGDGRLFDRVSTRHSTNELHPFCEVKVERFGWRRSSFVSRQNSPMLAAR